jgi:16S rRNA (cytosine1402-N4)-methyltransferase
VTGFAHRSVLVRETIDQLAPRNGGVYCDCTLGGGGHAEAILEAAPNARIIGVDRDPAALAAAHARLGNRIVTAHAEFGEIAAILASLHIPRVDGFVVDLGVSSPQLDDPARGFSFLRDGPLDMRMDPTRGPTALALLQSLDVAEIAAILSDLGEERHASRVARAVKEAVSTGVHTSAQLAEVVAKVILAREQRTAKIHPATRTFQALRIAVNRELDQLDSFLSAFPDLLSPGGRCVVISFHSLEDRRVKHTFRDLAWVSSLPPRLAREAGERIEPVVEVLTRRAIVANDDEVAANPRSRSAKLRACARTSAPNVPVRGSAGSPHRG